MLDMLSMLLRKNGDTTMYKILDKNTRNSILTKIQK